MNDPRPLVAPHETRRQHDLRPLVVDNTRPAAAAASRRSPRSSARLSVLNVEDLRQLALRWCPLVATYWGFVMGKTIEWGPAHELGHALVEPKSRRSRHGYGRCDIESCACPTQRCLVTEAAAMMISSDLHGACGRHELIATERRSTPSYDAYIAPEADRARAHLERLKLWPVPQTIRGLEVALRRAGLAPTRRLSAELLRRDRIAEAVAQAEADDVEAVSL